MSGWDDPQAPIYYEAFCRKHSRYGRANAALIAHARMEPGMRVLDLAAGTGRTAEAASHLNAVERLGQSDGVKLLLAMAAACVAVQKASPAEKATVFADARADLGTAAGACARSEIPPGVARWYRRLVSRLATDAGTISARFWALRQRFMPWVRE